MLSIFNGLRDINLLTVIIRLALTFVCGAAIGLERSYKNRPAGLRTHILVSLGACIASMTGLYLYLNAQVPTDISRLGAQVVSGLGFIGGGTIIVTKKKTIKGLNTAAGLWASGIIGLAIGAGFYEGGIITMLLVLATALLVPLLEGRIVHMPEFEIMLTYRNKTSLDHVLRYCKDNKLSISKLQVTGTNDSSSPIYSAIINLRPRQSVDHEDLIKHISVTVGVLSVVEL